MAFEFIVKVIKIGNSFISKYEYSQGYFDYLLVSDPLKAQNFELARDKEDFVIKFLNSEGVDFKIERYKISVERL